MKTSGILLSTLLCLLTIGQASAQVAATADVTNLQTADSVGTPTMMTVPGTGGLVGDTSNVITYNGVTTSITGLTAGGVNYVPLAYAGTITTTLQGVSGTTVGPTTNNVLYNSIVSQSSGSYTLTGPYLGNEQIAFNNNNLNLGTDNLFGNQGDSNGDNNNIERVDVVFGSGLTATDALAFMIFERGASTVHDPFEIAAITSIDPVTGLPTGYGQLIRFGASSTYGSYGTSVLAPSTDSTDWLITRNADDGSALPADDPSTVVNNQSIGGIAVSVTQTGPNGLGITALDTIYGYSLFGGDVPLDSTVPQLLDLLNATTYPKDTASATGAGGIDLVAYTGVAYNATAVPEPRTYAAWMLAMVIFLWAGRRFGSKFVAARASKTNRN